MANLRLNQVIALEKGAKGKTESAFTRIFRQLGNAGPMSGVARTYRPIDEEGDRLPAESTLLQIKVEDCLDEAAVELSRLLDLTATKDRGNQSASADLVVDGNVLIEKVPVTTLLTLEKKLDDLFTFVSKLPVLDPSEEWFADEQAPNVYKTKPVETTKTKKTPRAITLAPATDKHPAQVQIFNDDILVGYWTTIKYSGAVTEARRKDLIDRVRTLQGAVAKAREAANVTEVEDLKIGQAIFNYLNW